MLPTFASIESAHEFVGLLLDEAITEAAAEIDDLRKSACHTWPQRGDALLLIAYKLEQLRGHIEASYRRLDDLRALHCLLKDGGAVTPAS